MLTHRIASLPHSAEKPSALSDSTSQAMAPAPREVPVLPACGQMPHAAAATKTSLSPVRTVLRGPGPTGSPGIREATAGAVGHVTAKVAAHVQSGVLPLRGRYEQPVLRAAARRAAEGWDSLLKAKAGA